MLPLVNRLAMLPIHVRIRVSGCWLSNALLHELIRRLLGAPGYVQYPCWLVSNDFWYVRLNSYVINDTNTAESHTDGGFSCVAFHRATARLDPSSIGCSKLI